MAPALLLAATVLLAAPSQASLPNAPTIVLKKDELRRIPAPGLTRLATAAPEIVEVRPRGSEIELRGVRDGRTTLLLWFADGQRLSYLLQVGQPKSESTPPPVSGQGAEIIGDVRETDCTGEPAWTADLVQQVESLEKGRKYSEAVKKLGEVLKLRPEAAFLQARLGALYAKMGKQDLSAEAFGTFALACPDHPDAAWARDRSRKPEATTK